MSEGIVLIDYHHTALLQSFLYLFGKRLGFTVMRPFGRKWWHAGLRHPDDNWETGNVAFMSRALEYPTFFSTDDPDRILTLSHPIGRMLGYDEARDRGKEVRFVISTQHDTQKFLSEFTKQYCPNATYIRQAGNPSEHCWFTKHVLSSDIQTYEKAVAEGKHAVLYHQEFPGVYRPMVISLPWSPTWQCVRQYVNWAHNDKINRAFYLWFKEICQSLTPPLRCYENGKGGEDGEAEYHHEMVNNFAHSTFTLHHKWWDGYGMCYSEDTEVLTEYGWMSFRALNPSIRVATLRRGELIYEEATRRQAYHYEGDMLHFKGRSVDLLVTPDHQMYVGRKTHRRSGKRGEHHSTRWSKIRASSQTFKDLRPYSMSTSVQFLKAPRYWKRNRAPSTQHELDAAELLGWYVSEGCVGRNHGKPRRVIIANTKHKYLWEIATVAAALGYKPHIGRVHGRPVKVDINDSRLASEFSLLGRSWEKYIPRWILDGPRDIQLSFLRSYLKGDGSQSNLSRGSWTANTVSRRLGDDLQELCLKLGHRSSLVIRDLPNAKWRRQYKLSVDLRPNSRTKYLYYPPSRVSYDGTVYCVTVLSGLLVVRRNGHPVVCGNCVHQSYACGRPVICFEEDYKGKMAGRLMENMKTAVFISGDKACTVSRLYRAMLIAPEMQIAARKRFEEVVNWDDDEQRIRKWLSEI